MKKIYLVLLFFLVVLNTSAQIQWSWVYTLNGSNSQILVPSLASDVNGNYVAGTFDGTRSFGTYTLTASGSTDAFLAKYDNLGNCVWANHYGSSLSNTNSYAVAVDGIGNLYIAGTFTDTMVIGGTTLNPRGLIDMFLIKVNQSGSVMWAKAFGGQSVDKALSLAIDSQNNVYMSGSFFYKAYFDTDSIGNNILNNNIFFVKLNSAGQVQWLKEAGGSNDDECTGLSISGNKLFATGTIQTPNATFGSHTVNVQNSDGFIAKYDLAGNNIWVKAIGGAQNDHGRGVGSDVYGNSYVVGIIIQAVSFGNGISLNAGNYDQTYIAKYDSNGVCQWAKKGGNPTLPNFSGGIATDINGYSVVTGTFKGTANFTPFNISSSGAEEAFIVKYNPSGVCQYALKGGGSGADYGCAAAWTPSNDFVLGGSFQNSATFGGSITISTPAATTYSSYLGLLPGATAGIEDENAALGSFILVNNPASDLINLNFANIIEPQNVVLLNSLGQVVMNENINKNQNDLTLDVSTLQTGIYIVKINSKNSYLTKSIQIIK